MMEGAEFELFERSARHAVESNTGATLDSALAEMGWSEALGFDRRSAISVLFELQGSTNAVSSALNSVLLSGLGPPFAGATVLLPAFGDWRPPGAMTDGRVVVAGCGSALAAELCDIVVVVDNGDGYLGGRIPDDALVRRPIGGIDPWFGLFEVTGELAALELQPVDWGTTISLGQLAISHELVGASREMLALAREHALNRIQFGQPISRFQAVRHRLAECLVAIETADAMLDAAWLDQTPQTTAIAKALAGRGALVTARHCQQVLAGIGFTAEHPFHRHFRRALVLDGLLGASRSLTVDLGQHLLASRRLPELLPL
jgi:hypothetical protein